ncbi:MAG: amidohydrolase family protein [Victivallaceae bacterium]|nr:amidohydrolase family protein [Victivallaceae bacterium]
MKSRVISVRHFFDGEKLHPEPCRIEIADGILRSVTPGPAPDADEHHEWMLPPLAESHCHLFLDGDELDAAKRKAHLDAGFDTWLATGRRNLERCRDLGIRVIRDAGDVHGVNHRLREIAAGMGIRVISAGKAIRKAGRYGSFMALEVAGVDEIDAAVAAVAAVAEDSDTLKIVLSGIIDFANGKVKGEPQFTLEELRRLVDAGHRRGLRSFVHCSGEDGPALAVAAGVDSIEHGFFMTPAILEAMAAKQIAWTPTFIPVEFQYREPQYGGWDAPTRGKLRAILDNHARCLRLAVEYGVPVMAGSDAGSFGVRHGYGLLEELALMRRAGMSEEAVCAAATNVPRRHFGLPPVHLRPGERADCIFADALQ